MYISLILLGLFNVFKNSQRDYSSVSYTYSTLLDKAQNGEIKSVEIQGNNIKGKQPASRRDEQGPSSQKRETRWS